MAAESESTAKFESLGGSIGWADKLRDFPSPLNHSTCCPRANYSLPLPTADFFFFDVAAGRPLVCPHDLVWPKSVRRRSRKEAFGAPQPDGAAPCIGAKLELS